MTTPKKEIPTSITYPEYLNSKDGAYKYRKLTMNVVEMKTFSDGIGTALTKAKDRAKSVVDAFDSRETDSPDELIENLNKSYDKMVDGNTIYTIVLPLPNELTDTQQHDWNTEKGIVGTAIGGMEEQSAASAMSGTIGESIVGKASVVPLVGAGIAAAANMSVSQAIGSMADSAGLRKPLGDPGYFQNYTGSQPRTFNMTFDFVPANPTEAKTIFTIIMKLKEYSSPTLVSGGVSMLAPNFFDIDLSNKYISGLANIKGVVLQNIVVNYGADGAMQQHPDGTPKYIQLGLTFVERRMMHSGQYKNKAY